MLLNNMMFLYLSSMMYFMCFIMLIGSMMFMMLDSMYIVEWELFSVMSTKFKMDVMFEWSDLLYSSIILLISANVLKFSKDYMMHDPNKLRFTYIVLMFILSMNMLVYIPNMVCLLIGWDGLGVTSFILIMFYNNQCSLNASMLTMLMNRLGDMFMLMSIVMTLNMGDWTIINIQIMSSFNTLQLLGITVAAMTKSAQMPYSSWLPAAMAAPTPVSALVHSSTLVTAGIFLMYRFFNMIAQSTMVQLILIISGTLTMLMAGVTAVYENDMKKIVALSTLSQLGLMIMCLGLCFPNLAYMHMLVHALFKALLFIAAGSLISLSNHNQDLRMYGQSFTLSPVNSSSMFISMMALTGIPFMSGYYSKHLIMEWSSIMSINLLLFILILLSIMLTLCYSIRLIFYLLYMMTMKSNMYKHYKSNNNDYPMLTMSIYSIIMGSVMQWMVPAIMWVPPISENLKLSLLSTYLIFMALILMLMIMKIFSYPKYMNVISNKFILSLGFISPLWSKFSLSMSMYMSLKLYKFLDQAWLEKIVSLGIPMLMFNTSSYLNLSFEILSKQKSFLLMTMTSMVSFLSCIMLY